MQKMLEYVQIRGGERTDRPIGVDAAIERKNGELIVNNFLIRLPSPLPPHFIIPFEPLYNVFSYARSHRKAVGPSPVLLHQKRRLRPRGIPPLPRRARGNQPLHLAGPHRVHAQ